MASGIFVFWQSANFDPKLNFFTTCKEVSEISNPPCRLARTLALQSGNYILESGRSAFALLACYGATGEKGLPTAARRRQVNEFSFPYSFPAIVTVLVDRNGREM